MVSGDNVTVTLTGGSPWGFRLTGGGSMPLQIAKIRKKSQAHAQGLQEGDAVVSINGLAVHDRSHDEAVDLIDAAGDTLTLQIYRSDADDLGQLLASNRPHAPVLPPQDGGEYVVTSSSSSVKESGGTRREVQRNVFVSTDGDTERTTFVRREHTITTSSGLGDVNGNDVGGRDGTLRAQMEVSTAFQSSSAPAASPRLSLSPKPNSPRPAVSPKPVSPVPFKPSVSPKPVSSSPYKSGISPRDYSPKPVSPVPFKATVAPKAFSPKPVSPVPFTPAAQAVVYSDPAPSQHQVKSTATWAPKPTFKAVPPKVAPGVAPKPVPAVAPKPQFSVKPSFNAKAAAPAPAPMFAPQKFQVSATAMYAPQPYAPGAPQGQPAPQQPYAPGAPRKQAPAPQQQFSPGQAYASKQHLTQTSQSFSPGSQQPYSPMSISTPMSPASQPFSPISPGGNSTPMFNVRNNAAGGSRAWQANMWLSGQEPEQIPPQQTAPPPEASSENVEVPKRMSIKERQQLLLTSTARNHHSLGARQADPNFDAPPEEVQRMASHKMKIFGPPVEMTPEGPCDHWEEVPIRRTDSVESESSSPTSSLNRKKKMYADSAFYEDPSHKYPTIDEQMKLCRLISLSLTSAANRKARGAKMFAKRKRKSTKWVHESHYEWSSSGGGDVGNVDDLESELDFEEGGSKQLFMFRIPNLKNRVSSPEKNTKMSMKKDEFERVRLQAQKCDHRTVSPGTCFDIAADLKAHKGRGGRLFERRKNRADKFIIDESNAKVAGPRHSKLDDMLGHTPLKSSTSPWEAAQSNQQGSVDSAFDHLSEMERMQKMNQILKYTPPKPSPKPTREVLQPLPQTTYTGPKTDLTGRGVPILQGRNFNRLAKGWGAASGDSQAGSTAAHHLISQQPPVPAQAQDYPLESNQRAQSGVRVAFGDYNPRPRAWQTMDTNSGPASMSASWAPGDFDHSSFNSAQSPGAAAGFYSPDEIPTSDL